MFDVIASVLAWFYSLVDDYAISIMLLTLLIMLAFTPLTIKGTRSMMQMQEIQPEIKRLQAQHKGDRQKLNEEMMKLYQSHGVNPLGGCLPSLVQLPVFFVLYRVINGLTRTHDDGTPNPDHLDETSELYQDIIKDEGEMVSFGIDLSRSANEVLKDNFVDALPYLLLVAVTFFLSWYQQRQMRARRGDAAAANPQMEMMMKILPFMLPVFAFIVQAALAVYFITSSLYRIGQQAFIHATMKPAIPSAGDSIIDVEPEPDVESEPPVKEVDNKRSKKAIAAAEERQAARARRSSERGRPPKAGRGNEGRANGKAKSTRSSKPSSDDSSPPIQSRRTAGDGRTRKRRK